MTSPKQAIISNGRSICFPAEISAGGGGWSFLTVNNLEIQSYGNSRKLVILLVI